MRSRAGAAGEGEICHRGVVALFEVDSNETLQGYLTGWAEIIPATFDVLPLMDRTYQRQLIDDREQPA